MSVFLLCMSVWHVIFCEDSLCQLEDKDMEACALCLCEPTIYEDRKLIFQYSCTFFTLCPGVLRGFYTAAGSFIMHTCGFGCIVVCMVGEGILACWLGYDGDFCMAIPMRDR
jgi:hypothetical protein